MRKLRKRKIFITIVCLFILIVSVLVWFYVPYSPVKNEFSFNISTLNRENCLQTNGATFSEMDFIHLPSVIQNYIKNCGYIGTPKMSYLKMEYKNVDFKQGKNSPAMTIDYTQYNFVNEPCRLALIDSSMFGIPFEGYDYYVGGKGGMKGVIAKVITLFDQRGIEMDKACLVTYLAESLFVPTSLLQGYITFEEISEYKVKATITYGECTATGIFTFNDRYELISFTTNDRAISKSDGKMEYVPWSALCSNYKLSDNGIKYPAKFQAVWNYLDEDFIYFYGNIDKISYGF